MTTTREDHPPSQPPAASTLPSHPADANHQVQQLLALLTKEEKEETAARVQLSLTEAQVQKLLSFFTKEMEEEEEEEKRKRRKKSVGFDDDILFLFLRRLEADALYKLRTVSKQWHNLIMDPYFAISHLSYAPPGPGFLFQSQVYGSNKLAFLYLEGEQVVLRDLEISVPKPIIASCNGLVLFRDYPKLGDYFVGNPYGSKGKGEILPLQNYGSSSLQKVLGFTYVKETGEYKIVCMMREKDSTYCVMIFTLGSNTWTQVKDHDPQLPPADGSNSDGAGYGWQVFFPIMDSNPKPLWVNNFLHSLIFIEEAGDDEFSFGGDEFLFSIDTKNGTFHKNELPKSPSFCFSTNGLMNLGGVLALHSSRYMRVRIWILKDFYKKEWIQLHCFQVEGISKFHPDSESCLIGNLGNGKVLLYSDFLLNQGPGNAADVCYALDLQTKKVIKIFPISRAHRYLPHVNSLVDLKHFKF